MNTVKQSLKRALTMAALTATAGVIATTSVSAVDYNMKPEPRYVFTKEVSLTKRLETFDNAIATVKKNRADDLAFVNTHYYGQEKVDLLVKIRRTYDSQVASLVKSRNEVAAKINYVVENPGCFDMGDGQVGCQRVVKYY